MQLSLMDNPSHISLQFALHLAIIDLYDESPDRDDIINLDSQLESLFEYWYNQLSPQPNYLSSLFKV